MKNYLIHPFINFVYQGQNCRILNWGMFVHTSYTSYTIYSGTAFNSIK